MARKGEIVGAVDFGSREVRVVVALEGNDGSVQILGHGVAQGRGCVSQGLIQDLNAAQRALKHALSAAEKEAGVKLPSLFCGLSGTNVESFIREGNVTHIVIKDEKGDTLIEIPMTVGVVGVILLPVWAAIGAIAALAADLTIVVRDGLFRLCR